MKLGYSLSVIANAIQTVNSVDSVQIVNEIFYDTRKIFNGNNALFFCLQSERRDGHDFIDDAYQKGVRNFVVNEKFDGKKRADCVYLSVKNTLFALQELAKFHRSHFHYPIIGITGSTGKTTVKEWLYQLLQNDFKIIRSPKSYNSQLGVALSLLELSDEFNLALIEAGISKPNEMQRLAEMINPTIGILTNIGTAHRENFTSPNEIFEQKIQLFEKAEILFASNSIRKFQLNNTNNVLFPNVQLPKDKLKSWTLSYSDNLELTATVVSYLTKKEVTIEQLNNLSQLAMRMEVFEGINQTTIINDAYNLDLDALKQSLEFLVESKFHTKKVVLIVASEIQPDYKKEIETLIQNYPIDSVEFLTSTENLDVQQYQNATILIKGYRNSAGQKLAQKFKLQKHETVVEVDMDALRNNLQFFRSKIKPTTKILVMVKAFAYGAGAEKIASFLERNNVDYLGVAYADEGVILRNLGIQTPILVMNAEPYSYESIIENNLEPSIFSQKSLDDFIKTLINLGKENYPIHLKIDTGMHRLGLNPTELLHLVETLKAQPEVVLKGVYSHLADADNFENDSYSQAQYQTFDKAVSYLRTHFSQPFLAHLLNTEGTLRFPEMQYDMVRMGIGLYGYVSNPEVHNYLHPTIYWKTIISQIRTLEKGERISYNGRFTTEKQSKIATIPVGYADGLKRSYKDAHGEVFINGKRCPIVGTICMDMCMVDVSETTCNEGDTVEIIGLNIPIYEVAEKMNTIVYEVLTSISRRVHRIYLNE
ncbi:MAG TPA: alanine racemase [Crocinitomicaceae bacterium]|nr:alanine racemase [Crocinitomicaceae bacterium]